jgi:hypothetical protein
MFGPADIDLLKGDAERILANRVRMGRGGAVHGRFLVAIWAQFYSLVRLRPVCFRAKNATEVKFCPVCHSFLRSTA